MHGYARWFDQRAISFAPGAAVRSIEDLYNNDRRYDVAREFAVYRQKFEMHTHDMSR